MKLKKKSGLISAVIALSCASLVSVGFASWVISQGDEKVVNGSISVDTVTTQAYSITLGSGVTGGNLDQAITFGKASGETTYHWLDNNDMAENLSASFQFTISNIDAATVSGNSATLGTSGYTLTASLASEGYSAALSTGLSEGGNTYTHLVGALPTPTLAFAGGTFTCSVQFAWGTDFNEQNPYLYFNNKEGTAANILEAQNKLGALAKLNATYTITLTVAKA